MFKKVVHQGELAKSAHLGKDLVAINVFSDSDLRLLRAWMTKDRRDFAIVKKSNLSSQISQTSSTLKVLKKILKRFAAMAVFMGRDTEEALWRWVSYASYSVSKLPPSSAFLAVHKGKVILEILSVHHLQGSRLRPESYLNTNTARLRHADQEKPESEEVEYPAFQANLDVARDGNFSPNHSHKAILLNSISLIRRELPEPSLGWPLLPRKSAPNQELRRPEARDTSVVEWVMSLPNRVTKVVNQIALHSNQTSVISETKTNDSTLKGCMTEEAIHSSEAEPVINNNNNSKDENSGLEYNAEASVSLNTKDLESNSKPGRPLLRITASSTSDSFSEYEAIKMPMAERVIANYLPALRKMPNDLGLRCEQFTLRELKQATSGFSRENLIGEGGCSNVYKGYLPGGKPVAVKILKSYKEAWNDFSLEVDIVSSLKHEHITPLIGVCFEDDHLISVYDFFPKGSLEEILHGQSKKSMLPWGVRFKVAMAIAEALNYLHNECFPPVIHRDVKSSNILLSDDFQPQLSDFGLAIWGPTDSTFMIESNVVGTFGYIAPEYFMEGRVSDKIDVYSFGVVLLELISGRRPISSKALEGQESLIKWARALVERRNLQGLLDPALDGDLDLAQMNRMVLAASLCLNQLGVYRPKVSQILEILRGEKEPTEWPTCSKVPNNQEDDDDIHKLYMQLSVSSTDHDSTSACGNHITSGRRAGKQRRLMLRDYLRTDRLMLRDYFRTEQG